MPNRQSDWQSQEPTINGLVHAFLNALTLQEIIASSDDIVIERHTHSEQLAIFARVSLERIPTGVLRTEDGRSPSDLSLSQNTETQRMELQGRFQ